MSDEEIEEGVVGVGKDGGIDGIYTFLHGDLLTQDSSIFEDNFALSSIQRDSSLEVWLTQAKRESSFTETAVEEVSDSIDRLFDLGTPESDLLTLYSSDVVSRIEIYRNSLRKIASRFPNVKIVFAYGTRGDTSTINKKIYR